MPHDGEPGPSQRYCELYLKALETVSYVVFFRYRLELLCWAGKDCICTPTRVTHPSLSLRHLAVLLLLMPHSAPLIAHDPASAHGSLLCLGCVYAKPSMRLSCLAGLPLILIPLLCCPVPPHCRQCSSTCTA